MSSHKTHIVSTTTDAKAGGTGSISTPINTSPVINLYGGGTTSTPALAGDGGSASAQGAQPLSPFGTTMYPAGAPDMATISDNGSPVSSGEVSTWSTYIWFAIGALTLWFFFKKGKLS